ncbi:MAG: hypothetical protein KGL98_04505 [Gammaproteobacteria bacterium]|nr:hypothetical protein [Gammaproteobacteria bacterium]MBU6509266.1 hypothetical protein [Gammaproteobacteria bacterium]MDE1983207.1 hypothetical protein [Gammaproteobacteria bacterium]MDE2107720.1 hypothetical protein [Gammaproteobacteria bacterium]MDE2460487.1 hypothetical protein [Gammaproteobacteria bacterium]
MGATAKPLQLPIGAALEEGWRLFLKSLPAVFLPLWAACLVDALPGVFGGGGLLNFQLTRNVILITVLCWLVESGLYGAAILRMDACAAGVTRSYADSLRAGAGAALTILVGDLLYNLATWVGFFLLILPGVILGTTLAFFACAAVLDRKNIVEVIGYSHRLARPQWWRSSAVLSAPAIVLLVYDVIAGWPDIMSAVRQLSSGNLSPAASPVNLWYDLGLMPVVGALVWCYVLAVVYVQYRNLKARARI